MERTEELGMASELVWNCAERGSLLGLRARTKRPTDETDPD